MTWYKVSAEKSVRSFSEPTAERLMLHQDLENADHKVNNSVLTARSLSWQRSMPSV
jgi:hypothetical protein